MVTFGVEKLDENISIREVMMIYHGSPYEVQTEMQGKAEGDRGRKKIAGRCGRRPPLFLWAGLQGVVA